MSKKATKTPDSDSIARHRTEDMQDEIYEDAPERLEDRQTSNKSGSPSDVEKLAASRSEFAPRASAGPVPGAGGPDEPSPPTRGAFRCESCNRTFDTETELRRHQPECRRG